jgi:hypothetical protein
MAISVVGMKRCRKADKSHRHGHPFRRLVADQATGHPGPDLARHPIVGSRQLAIVLGMTATFGGVDAKAAADHPVFVTVVGHGAVRFRLAAGITAPCDSDENRMLFDGWIGVGRYEWSTGASTICYQHTSGALREVDWSEPRVISTLGSRGRGSSKPPEILISTD